MTSVTERTMFSKRLAHALGQAKYSATSPTVLQREFNARTVGNPITVHAARKWLVGEAIPTQSKLRTLAHMTGVSPDWLRFGDDAEPTLTLQTERFKSEHVRLIDDLQGLDERGQTLAREFIRMLVRLHPKVAA